MIRVNTLGILKGVGHRNERGIGQIHGKVLRLSHQIPLSHAPFLKGKSQAPFSIKSRDFILSRGDL